MKPIFPSIVPTWHNTPYDAISPSLPALSCAGQTVVITGGGRGIGVAIAKAFADAGAARLILLGRTLSTLEETKRLISERGAKTEVHVYAVDILDAAEVKKIAAETGSWDVLVGNAGYLSTPKSMLDSDPADWWKSFEVNVLGSLYLIQAFVPHRKTGARYIAINTVMAVIPPGHRATQSAYSASKLAQANLVETLTAEVEDLHVVNVHPGVVMTDMTTKAAVPGVEKFLDHGDLPAHFCVWVASPSARFLQGRYVYANWDVGELQALEGRIKEGSLLTTTLGGSPWE